MSVLIANNVQKVVSLQDSVITILKDVKLIVKQGETVSILGVSGSGKSTLLGLLAGLDNPSAGSIELFHRNLNELDEEAKAQLRQQQVGFVFQDFHLLPQLTALENVMLPLEIAGVADAKSKAQLMLSEVGLEHRMDHKPSQLSGGEQQRVALGRAFVTEPKIIFADEPTGSLDEKTGLQVVEKLYQMNQAYQTTLIMVTHDTKVAERSQSKYRLVEGRLESFS